MDLSPLTYYGSFNHIPFSLLLSGRGQVTGAVRSPRNLAMGRPVCSVMTDAAVKGTEIRERMSWPLWWDSFPQCYELMTQFTLGSITVLLSALRIIHRCLLDSTSSCLLCAMTSSLLCLVLSIWHLLSDSSASDCLLRGSQDNVSVWSCSLMVTWLLWMHKAQSLAIKLTS